MPNSKFFEFLNHDKTGTVVDISIDKIQASRYQPRLKFDEMAMQELTDSIMQNGLISPITVREVEDHYEIIAGERRFRSCQKAGFTEIPCYVLSPSENQAAEMALVENIQRENLTAVEEAKSYVQIMRQAGLTQEQVAARVGKSQSAVANKIRLLNLPDEIQEAVVEKKLTERHARALLSLPEEKQKSACHYIIDRGLNVRQSEAYIEKLSGPAKSHKRQKTKGFSRNTQIGINSVNQCIRIIKKMGIDVVEETEETLTDVRIVIRFPKS
ncbi:MAG: ParB/RepB/Spo0J family partition protein [Erysipelotrichia bacterium]|nr:ParB/RepB/Spo0J family partition protein [Erysipelotrichia bacterium]